MSAFFKRTGAILTKCANPHESGFRARTILREWVLCYSLPCRIPISVSLFRAAGSSFRKSSRSRQPSLPLDSQDEPSLAENKMTFSRLIRSDIAVRHPPSHSHSHSAILKLSLPSFRPTLELSIAHSIEIVSVPRLELDRRPG